MKYKNFELETMLDFTPGQVVAYPKCGRTNSDVGGYETGVISRTRKGRSAVRTVDGDLWFANGELRALLSLDCSAPFPQTGRDAG